MFILDVGVESGVAAVGFAAGTLVKHIGCGLDGIAGEVPKIFHGSFCRIIIIVETSKLR